MSRRKRNKLSIILILGAFISFTILSCFTPERISVPGSISESFPISKNGLWGYAVEGGKMKIDYQYEAAEFFSSGLAAVKTDGKYGFINNMGKFEIKPKYDSIIKGYGYDAAFVSVGDKSHWINRKGKKMKKHSGVVAMCGTPDVQAAILEVHFQKINGKFQLKENEFIQQQRLDPQAQFTIQDFTFDEVSEFSSRSLIVRKGKKYKLYVPFNGIGLTELWYDELIPNRGIDSETTLSQAPTTAMVRQGNKWGLISLLGQVLIEPEFISIKPSTGNFFLVEYKQGHWGHMNLKKRYF